MHMQLVFSIILISSVVIPPYIPGHLASGSQRHRDSIDQSGRI